MKRENASLPPAPSPRAEWRRWVPGVGTAATGLTSATAGGPAWLTLTASVIALVLFVGREAIALSRDISNAWIEHRERLQGLAQRKREAALQMEVAEDARLAARSLTDCLTLLQTINRYDGAASRPE